VQTLAGDYALLPAEARMSISPYLSRQAFGPEVTRAMSIAFDEVCRALAIGDTGIVRPRIVARKIIELAQTGEHDPDRLRDRTLEAFAGGPWRPPAGPPSGATSPE
jgi:hypothetical protein